MIVIATIALLQVASSYLSFRLARFRRVLQGEPIVIVQDGKPIERNLRRERLTADDIAEEARQQQIGSIEEVQWAVLEPNGKISFIQR